jgi:uncharacterized protein YabE (DUF348 family)
MQMELRFPAKRFVAFAMMIIVFLSSVVTAVATTIAATIVDGGKSYTVQVFSADTENILEQAHVRLDSDDLVARNDDHGIVITIRRGFRVAVSADGKSTGVPVHTGDTVQYALDQAKISLGANDVVSEPLGKAASDGMKIAVTRRYKVNVVFDGGKQSPLVPEGTVAQALKSAGVKLGKEDLVTPSADTKVKDGLTIAVKRVTYRETRAAEEIPFTTVVKESTSVSQGASRIAQAGQNGLREAVYREKLIDGVVYERDTVSSGITKQPVAQIKLVAPKVVQAAKPKKAVSSGGALKDKNGKTIRYSRYISGICTAYTSNGGTTATGRKAKVGHIAVDPKVIPYGTRLYIASPNGKTVYGYAIAADTGGAMLSGRVLADLYYDTESECRSFGVRNMRLYILA